MSTKTKHPLYGTWLGMIARCHRTYRKEFNRYGGRGIKVCDRWRYSFENFVNDMGEKPTPKHTIERMDNNGNYEPSNCKWATQKEQQNNRRNQVLVLFRGEKITISGLAEKYNIKPAALWCRIFRENLPVEEALYPTRPAHYRQISHDGKKQSLKKWAEETGVEYHTLYYRIFTAKWPVSKALNLCV